ncbi:hypothetical protein [Dactylosporangium sp. NPDC000521]|uniref:hypothetical protein n=1 Tax=Dactylosporangium sp. NPDC000521 TaxID=3363975 RepID=UPI0036975466
MRFLMAIMVAAVVLLSGVACGGDPGTPASSAAARTGGSPGPECRGLKDTAELYLPAFIEADGKALAAIKRGDTTAAAAAVAEQDGLAKEWAKQLRPLTATVSDPDLKEALTRLVAALEQFSAARGTPKTGVVDAAGVAKTALDKACA